MKKFTSALLASTIMLLANDTVAQTENLHWGYTGHNTPDKWGSLSEKYRECGVGLNQSPINITHSLHANLPPLAPSYQSDSKDVIDNGHTIQINMAHGSTIKVDDIVFELKQFHFHTPSENHINGKAYPLEGHFVNIDKDGNIAVLGVMFTEGEENKALAKFWDKLPTNEGEVHTLEHSKIANELLPKDKHYYRFNGSLTTPPCTEGVRWFVFKETLSISKEQVAKFHKIMHGDNNRPIQPLDARVVVD
ncbi:carbonic anhydrase [Sulfurovum sp. TSL1]|uniref:carbonic anhydrase n=1 Tax=Sulfurovum sp. TSL1 TaxID=2826994 RepID=UPI001CC6A151|nr:carbonic anhydrase family protein [Sulfurovum sp. TSL1]GIT97634.1 carbonic anhydrase [Sulfurovum sp. TSL1]